MSKERGYPVSTQYPTVGATLSANEIERSLEAARDIWDEWLAIATKRGPTHVDAQQMLLRIGTQIAHLEALRYTYFHYPVVSPVRGE